MSSHEQKVFGGLLLHYNQKTCCWKLVLFHLVAGTFSIHFFHFPIGFIYWFFFLRMSDKSVSSIFSNVFSSLVYFFDIVVCSK